MKAEKLLVLGRNFSRSLQFVDTAESSPTSRHPVACCFQLMQVSRFFTPRSTRCLPRGSATRLSSSRSPGVDDTQDDGLKHLVRPTWSVHELLSAYPAPRISDTVLEKLHKVSALIPPPKESPAFAKRKHQLEELIRLVEAVRLVNVNTVDGSVVPDGRVLAQGYPIDAPDTRTESCVPQVSEEPNIMQHATRSVDGYYIVETPPSRK